MWKQNDTIIMLKRNTIYVYKQNIIFTNWKKNLKITNRGHSNRYNCQI